MAAEETAATQANEDTRGTRRKLQGVVTSIKMDKTITVVVVRRVRDRRFHKFVKQQSRYKAHDEKNVSRVGDLVELIGARAYSKTKGWRLLRTIEQAREEIK